MSWYSLDLLYDITVAATISIEAESVEEACRLAIEQADAIDAWKTTDHASDPYVFAILRTDRPDPSAGRCTPVPVPDTYARDAPPPTVTFIGNQPPDAIVIEDGTARIRVLHPSFALASELSDPAPPPGNKPRVTISRRRDGTPDISVTGGSAEITVIGWNIPDLQDRQDQPPRV